MAEQSAHKVLVAYYSLTGETLGEGWDTVQLEKGFTAQAAEIVCSAVNGDLFEIETIETYPESHMGRVERSRVEIASGHMPELEALPPHFDDYAIVFLCYPVWWLTAPPAVASFAKALDWSGKRIVPLSTSHSSGSARSVEDLRSLCANGDVEDGAAVLGQQVGRLGQQIANWAKAQI